MCLSLLGKNWQGTRLNCFQTDASKLQCVLSHYSFARSRLRPCLLVVLLPHRDHHKAAVQAGGAAINRPQLLTGRRFSGTQR